MRDIVNSLEAFNKGILDLSSLESMLKRQGVLPSAVSQHLYLLLLWSCVACEGSFL